MTTKGYRGLRGLKVLTSSADVEAHSYGREPTPEPKTKKSAKSAPKPPPPPPEADIDTEPPPPEPKKTAKKSKPDPDYDEWTVEELYDLAAELEISGRSSMVKSELIKAIKKETK
jgi:hypothetical protein